MCEHVLEVISLVITSADQLAGTRIVIKAVARDILVTKAVARDTLVTQAVARDT